MLEAEGFQSDCNQQSHSQCCGVCAAVPTVGVEPADSVSHRSTPAATLSDAANGFMDHLQMFVSQGTDEGLNIHVI